MMTSSPKAGSEAVTRGVRVRVTTQYLADQSSAMLKRWVFSYTIRISNESNRSVQLKSRHWVITHGDGHKEEVRGPGVVGEQPMIGPGESFEYTSGCVLRTPRGTMHGEYQMVTLDGDPFDATVAEFALETPHSLN